MAEASSGQRECRILVFGGEGFSGAAIVARLLANGVGPVAAVARHPVSAPAGIAVRRGGAIGRESVTEDGRTVRFAASAGARGYLVPLEPPVLVVRRPRLRGARRRGTRAPPARR
jgi:nucleoside-diphosphate-sugar epimerase